MCTFKIHLLKFYFTLFFKKTEHHCTPGIYYVDQGGLELKELCTSTPGYSCYFSLCVGWGGGEGPGCGCTGECRFMVSTEQE
jgi:hypothetical protein